MKIAIQKVIGDLGEVWQIEVPVSNDVLKSADPVAGVKAVAAVALRVADDRLRELNMRLLDHNKMAQTLTPEALLALRQTIEVMYGSRVAPDGPERPGVKVVKPDEPIPSDDRVAANLEKALEAADRLVEDRRAGEHRAPAATARR